MRLDSGSPLRLSLPSDVSKRSRSSVLKRPTDVLAFLVFASLVDVFSAAKAMATAAIKSALAIAMQALPMVVVDFIRPPMRAGLEAKRPLSRTTAGKEWVGYDRAQKSILKIACEQFVGRRHSLR